MSAGRQLHVEVVQKLTSDSVLRETRLKADGEADTISVIHEVFDTSVGDLPVLDGLMQAALFYCMQRGLPVRIHGNISSQAAYNLHEFQRAWTLWNPGRYRHVELIPDAVVADQPRSGKVIQAFSGGVDANFTLIANRYLHREQGGYEISTALLVHGMDVGYDNSSGFSKLVERVKKALDHVGVEIKIVRTNSRLLGFQSWMDSNAAQLSACLHQFSGQYGKALIGSSEPYDALCLPTGSNPITDHLLSGGLMAIVHDGAAYSRTEKVEAICKFPFLVDQLKVCWEGRNQHENCGNCEKCLRTRMNFAAVGHNEPGCFQGRFEARMVRSVRGRTPIQIAELKGILTYAKRRKLAYPWLNSLRRQILFSRFMVPVENLLHIAAIKQLLRNGKRKIFARPL